MVLFCTSQDIQNLPVLSMTYNCVQRLSKTGKKYIMESAKCEECHMFAPFSKGQSGGRTKVHQSLTFRETRKGIKRDKGIISFK